MSPLEKPRNLKQSEIETQHTNVAHFYDEAATIYEEGFEGKAEYQIPGILLEIYKKHGITKGSVLDIGCGTGKLAEYVGNSFAYQGIDISPAMIEEARKRGVQGQAGPAEDIIQSFGDKSVDHITALSSVYWIRDFEILMKECERVARQSIFVSLEQFDPSIVEMMKEKGLDIYSHSASTIHHPTEVRKNVFLWKRPTTEERIYGDVVFKKLL